MELPMSGLFSDTSSSRVYSRGFSNTSWAGLRSGSSRFPARSIYAMPNRAQGNPILVISNIPSPSLWKRFCTMVLTTRFVLVPIRVQMPPKIEA